MPWGKNQPSRAVPAFTAIWMGMLGLAMGVALTGIRPLQLVNISVIFGMVVMPFTYYPILRAAADKKLMGKHVNSKFDSVVAALFLVLIIVAAAVAVPLMILTNSGQP